MEQAVNDPGSGFTPRGLALALSIGLHLLLIWHLGNWYRAGWNNHSPSTFQQPLHITITRRDTLEQESQPTPSFEPTSDLNIVKKNSPQSEPADQVSVETTIADSSRERTVTTAQIKQSVETVIQKLADDGLGKEERKSDSVSAILDRALNRSREKPGIHTRADGTTRIVTEQGYTYCIKPLDDWRIIDPGDDMRVSMSCQ